MPVVPVRWHVNVQILGEKDMRNILRMQFAMVPPGAEIKTHQDNGGWARRSHRIHVPIVVSEGKDS